MKSTILQTDFAVEIEKFTQTFNADGATKSETIEDTNTFENLLYQKMKERLDKSSILDFHLVANTLQKGLLCARNNQLSLSSQYYSEADTYKAEIKNEEVSLLLKSFEYPAKSYLTYKLFDYAGAESMLIKAVEVDDLLEQKGYDIMHFHKVQQLHNISRISFANKEEEAWKNAVRKLINYLMFGETPRPYGNWGISSIKKCPDSSRSGMLFQVFAETLLFNLYLTASRPNRSIHSSIWEIFSEIDFQANTPDEEGIKEWLQLKSLAKNDSALFLEQVTGYLLTKRSKFNLFKAYLLLDVLKVEEAEETALQSKIEATIKTILKNKTGMGETILNDIIKDSCY